MPVELPVDLVPLGYVLLVFLAMVIQAAIIWVTLLIAGYMRRK